MRRPPALIGVLIGVLTATAGAVAAATHSTTTPEPRYHDHTASKYIQATGFDELRRVPIRPPAIRLLAPARIYDSSTLLARMNTLPAPGFFAPEAAGAARATVHGAERLSQAGFTDDVIRLTKTEGISFGQADGAQVFLREASPGRFDFIVEGARGPITAHRGWSLKSVERLARNYGWDWP